MLQIIEANWIALAVVLLLAVAVAWWVWGRGTSAGSSREVRDVLSEGAERAQRNTALIDAPSAASFAASGPDILGGIGEIAAHGAEEEVEHAQVLPEPEVAPPAPPSEPAPAAPQSADDLTRIKGVGPKLKTRLAELGVTSFAQIAGWSGVDLAGIDAQLGAFAGRPERDNWVEQARLLASGDTAAYEAKFGKL
ncbi:MAG: hypothetical protein KGL48_07080 [Sphingomonadales bacterium]|nr:hypothetical protein [Sphingomonadales bacterium]MDE2569744.1 hypothetical protein [Sphingomonadales bacterium]